MSIFENIQASIIRIGKQFSISEATINKLITPNKVIEDTINIDGIGDINVYRVQFNNALGPYKGGVRFHHHVDLDEVKALSITMMLKSSLIGIPLGGAKGGAQIDVSTLNESQKEQVARGWVRAMNEHIGVDKDIPAPDVNTNNQVMAWMLDEFEQINERSEPGMITGKPITLGGSLGRMAATSQGGVYVLEKVLEEVPLRGDTKKVIVQGFGNVGSHVAQILHDRGFTTVGVSDKNGAVYIPTGINPHTLIEKKQSGSSVSEICEMLPDAELLSNEELLKKPCDILIPAALENVITTDNASEIQATHILELANNPTSKEADEILQERGIIVIPDILANAGGVTVSYFEWVQNRQQYYWTAEEVDMRLFEIMTRVTHNIIQLSHNDKLTLREAGYAHAIKRLAEAVELRGGKE